MSRSVPPYVIVPEKAGFAFGAYVEVAVALVKYVEAADAVVR